MVDRYAIVGALVVLLVAARIAYRRWRRDVETERPAVPPLPVRLRAGADRTWVVFTTPYCASCGPVTESLRAADPTARVVTVDATAEPDLAEAYRVRSAPTVLLASADGTVRERLVGAAAVRRRVGAVS